MCGAWCLPKQLKSQKEQKAKIINEMPNYNRPCKNKKSCPETCEFILYKQILKRIHNFMPRGWGEKGLEWASGIPLSC